MAATLGPSVRKAGSGGVVRRERIERLCLLDGWWAHVLSRADVVSEGSVVEGTDGAVYYGTVSVRCSLEPLPAPLEAISSAELTRLVLADPHARLRLVRLVHREVASRAPSPLGVVGVELEPVEPSAASPEPTSAGGGAGASIEVRADVEAAISPRARRAARRGL